MFKGLIKYRPKNLCAIYVEERHIEIMRAERKWRKWETEPPERYQVPEGESLFDYLQHLNLRPKSRKGSALLLFVPSTFYSIHREHYPASLKDQLEEAIDFDWQENLFYENGNTLHFYGTPVTIDNRFSVPVFSMQQEVYDKFHQILNAQLFQIFTITPSGPAYETFVPSPPGGNPEEPLEIVARRLDDEHIEVHRFYMGSFLDSMLIGKSDFSLKVFRENLGCMGNGNGDGAACSQPQISLLCTAGEFAERGGEYGREWADNGLPLSVRTVDDALVGNWVKRLLNRDFVQTFDTQVLLRPWQLPKVVYPILGAILLFAAYAFYQLNTADQLNQASKRLKRQLNHLEIQWKPIEEFQTRIAKFQEDKKTLSEFSREGYPLLELLSYLTVITPDDTWLNYVSLRKGQLILRGESKSAIKYLSELSKAEGLTDVKFASPVTRNPATDMERFNVQIQLDVAKLKKGLETLPVEKYEPLETAKPARPAAAKTGPEVMPQDDTPVEELEDVTLSEDEIYIDEPPLTMEETQ